MDTYHGLFLSVDASVYVPLIALGAALFATVVIFIVIKVLAKKKKPNYRLKDSLLTRTEINYYNVINSYFGRDYLVLPQINLASVIDKEGAGYRSELFRNVDFGIFDYNFRPILLIEINDGTHLKKDRKERDVKVSTICKKAHIPLVTFWTKDGIDNEVIYRTIKRYL